MVGVAFSAVLVVALVSGAFFFVMRIRVMRADSARNRIEWLSFRSSDDVLETYEALFPRSVLPRFCRFAFWAAAGIGTVGLYVVLTLRVLGR